MHASQRPATRQQQRVRRHAGRADAPAMFNLLTGPQLLERVEAALPEHRERLYPPTETLSMFVAQVLSADGSCQQAVDAAMVTRLIAGLAPGSTDTGAYCKARARLPLAMIATLARECGDIVANDAPGWWHWRGRRVLLVDGATVTLADTEDNQAAYPQPSSQKEGLGFPLARMVALLCLGSGALRDVAVGPCVGKGGDEQSLLRDILDTAASGRHLARGRVLRDLLPARGADRRGCRRGLRTVRGASTQHRLHQRGGAGRARSPHRTGQAAKGPTG